MCKRLLRHSVCLHSQPPSRKLCVNDESLDSLGWCELVPPLFWVLASASVHNKETVIVGVVADIEEDSLISSLCYHFGISHFC